MRSAFEQTGPGYGGSPSSGASSAGDSDAPKKRQPTRIVGFPDSPQPSAFESIARAQSCELSSRPKRQSSLGQQLLLNSWEKQDKPKLPAINTQTPRRLRITPSRMRTSAAVGSHPPQPQHPVGISHAQTSTSPESTLPGTLPSGHMLRSGSSSMDATPIAIPQHLSRAYTAPEPLPEVSPRMAQMIISGHADSQRSSPGTHGPPNGAPPHLQLSPANSGGLSRYSTAQVVALREALRREQEEVARLRREVSLMKAQDHHRRTPSAGCSGDRDGPVTPEAPAEQHAREAIMSIPSDGDISTPCMSTSGAPWVQRAAFF